METPIQTPTGSSKACIVPPPCRGLCLDQLHDDRMKAQFFFCSYSSITSPATTLGKSWDLLSSTLVLPGSYIIQSTIHSQNVTCPSDSHPAAPWELSCHASLLSSRPADQPDQLPRELGEDLAERLWGVMLHHLPSYQAALHFTSKTLLYKTRGPFPIVSTPTPHPPHVKYPGLGKPAGGPNWAEERGGHN